MSLSGRTRLALLLLALLDGTARAQSRAFDVDHLELAITSGEFLGVEGVSDEAPWSIRFGAAWRWSRMPLVAEGPQGTLRMIVDSRSLADATMTIQLWRRLGLGVD